MSPSSISISRYRLLPRLSHEAAPRLGCLLMVEFRPGLIGYADCHPWPELGDAAIGQQIELLKAGHTTALLDRSLAFALMDAQARQSRLWMFERLKAPLTHATFPFGFGLGENPLMAESRLDFLQAQGFELLKIKVGRSPLIEIEELTRNFSAIRSRGFRVRLDFNELLSADDVSGFLSSLISELGKDLSWIDWVEDPCPFDVDHWERLREEFQVPLALDRGAVRLEQYREIPADTIILKPAISDPLITLISAGQLGIPVAVTSYLDHPLGQVTAAWVASSLELGGINLRVGGLATHLAYEPNRFSEELVVDEGRLIPPRGTGFGFDQALEEQDWITIFRSAP